MRKIIIVLGYVSLLISIAVQVRHLKEA